MAKRIAILTSLMVLTGLALPASAPSKCAPDRYIMYENTNYGGHGRGQCVSAPDLRDVEWGFWAWEDYDDMISSTKTLGAGVHYYDGYNYSSWLVHYAAWSNIPNVGANLNDRFSSAWNGF